MKLRIYQPITTKVQFHCIPIDKSLRNPIFLSILTPSKNVVEWEENADFVK